MSKKFDINLLIDRSGSMETAQLKDHIGGIRSFVRDQQGKGPTDFTFIQFDSDMAGQNSFEVMYDAVDIESVNTEDLNLIPRGGTPLLDSVGKTVAHIESRKNEDTQVVLFIVTDGEENSSKEWTKEKVKEALGKQKDWQVMYLVANVDAFGDKNDIGTSYANTAGYANTKQGVDNLWKTNMGKLGAMRAVYGAGGNCAEALTAGGYTTLDRTELSEGDESVLSRDPNYKK